MKILLSIYNFFCSLKLAIFTLSSLVILFAIGTFYESALGREAAMEVIYGSSWMTILISLLTLNIVAVMLDRWPWKKKHIPFLFAHFGILFVIAGSLMTKLYGVDGYLRLGLGKSSEQITTSDTLLMVYSSFDGINLTEMYREKVHFYRHPPSKNSPYLINLGSDILKVTHFYPATRAREKYEVALRGGPALRFQIEGREAQILRWIFRPPWKDEAILSLGPAQILLLKSFPPASKKQVDIPSLLLVSQGKKLKYQLRRPGSEKIKEGSLKRGSVIQTSWMNFTFRVIEYLPQALPNTEFTPQKMASDQTNPAVQLEFRGEKRGMGLNSHLFFFDKEKVYVAAYTNEKKNLGFKLHLENFKVTRYPSSFKASSYESRVQIKGEKESHVISMNEPLKRQGYTIYQSGFEENKKGEPVASVFSINKDPGRFVKYLGSLLIVLGSFALFLRRNLRARRKKLSA